MTWNYRIIRHREGGRFYFAIHEVFYEDDRPVLMTEEETGIIEGTEEGMRRTLAKIAESEILDEELFNHRRAEPGLEAEIIIQVAETATATNAAPGQTDPVH